MVPQTLPLLNGDLKAEIGRKSLCITSHSAIDRLCFHVVQLSQVKIQHHLGTANQNDSFFNDFPRNGIIHFSSSAHRVFPTSVFCISTFRPPRSVSRFPDRCRSVPRSGPASPR